MVSFNIRGTPSSHSNSLSLVVPLVPIRRYSFTFFFLFVTQSRTMLVYSSFTRAKFHYTFSLYKRSDRRPALKS